MTDFAGWELPLHFGSQLQEHRAVRGHAGVFDVSHMTIADVQGDGARDYLRRLVSNDVDRIARPGGAVYGCLLNQSGGIIDDLIVYRWDEGNYRVITNAATRARVEPWLLAHAAPFGVRVEFARDLAMLAVQGPQARALADACLPERLRPALPPLERFCAVRDGRWQVARTGYTGEDGYEIILPGGDASAFWKALLASGVQACGLGARDTLRLEAGMRLYGVDMDEDNTPAEAGLTWTVALDPAERDFVGRRALEERLQSPPRWEFAGLVLEEPGVLRSHQTVDVPGLGSGVITSGGFSPGLNRAIAFARLPLGSKALGRCQVAIRDQRKAARICAPRFLSNA